MSWFRARDEGISGSYDFAEGIPVWKTRWFLASAVCVALVVGILALFLMGWI
jgi:hypothetical protein